MMRTFGCAFFYSPRKETRVTDKKMPQRKEITSGVAGKYETAPKSTKVQNKKCGGQLKKAPVKAKKSK